MLLGRGGLGVSARIIPCMPKEHCPPLIDPQKQPPTEIDKIFQVSVYEMTNGWPIEHKLRNVDVVRRALYKVISMA
jgi:hypothetical protein